MPLAPGTHTLGPDDGRLTVRTGKGGAAAKAGHDLLIEVTRWEATVDADAAPAIALTADSRSLRVLEGSGGISPDRPTVAVTRYPPSDRHPLPRA